MTSNDGVVSTITVGNANYLRLECTPGLNCAWSLSAAKAPWALMRGRQRGQQRFPGRLRPPGISLPSSPLLQPACRLYRPAPLGDPATIVTVTYDYTRTSTNSSHLSHPTTLERRDHQRHLMSLLNLLPSPGAARTRNQPFASTARSRLLYTSPVTPGPTYSYTWTLFTTNAVYTTNYYDHVIASGDYYTTDDMHGSILVIGCRTVGAAEWPEHERK